MNESASTSDSGATPDTSEFAETIEIEAGPWIPKTSVAAATWALFLGLGLVMIGNGLNGSVLGVRAEQEGFGTVTSGLIMASHFLGFLAGSRYAEHVLQRVGHIRVFAALASGASSVVLIQAISVAPITWAITRFLFGACIAGLYVVVESWLNDLSTNKTRGRILSVYMIVSMGGIGVGQLMLQIEDRSGFRLFIFVSVLVSMSLLPVTLSASSTPPLVVPEPMPLRQLVKIVPTGVFTSFWSGAATGAVMGMGAFYGALVGMSAGQISIFLSAPILGTLLFQWPIGWASDRLPRRGVIFFVAAAGTAFSAAGVFFAVGSVASVISMTLLGGVMFPLYSLTIAYTNDWIRQEEILGASATLIRVSGSGAVFGPVATAVLMSLAGPSFFFWTLAGLHGVIALYVLARIVQKDPLPVDDQQAYVAVPARSLSGALGLMPKLKKTSQRTRKRQSEARQSDRQGA